MPSRAEKTIIDVLFDPQLYKISTTPLEVPEERAARLEREAAEAEHRRRKELLLIWSGITFVGVGLVVSTIAAMFPIGSAEERARAWTILTMIFAGFIGFLTGRQFPSESSSEGRR